MTQRWGMEACVRRIVDHHRPVLWRCVIKKCAGQPRTFPCAASVLHAADERRAFPRLVHCSRYRWSTRLAWTV